MWRRCLGLVALLTMTVMVAGGSSAMAAVGSNTATYAPVAPATTAQMKADVRILALRLDRLGAAFVHVSVSHGDIILSSASHVITASLVEEIGQTGRLYVRPVLCYAYPQTKTSPRGVTSIPACAQASQLTAANLHVTSNDSAQGYSIQIVPPDPQYADVPSTSTNEPAYANSTVLLPGLSANDNGERYVLGPAEMTGESISSAKATKNQVDGWVVDFRLAGSSGSELWDHLSEESFHQVVGFDFDGVVYSAPLIQPSEFSFTSFNGKGEISGSLTKSEAENLSLAIKSGALPVPLQLERLSNDGADHTPTSSAMP